MQTVRQAFTILKQNPLLSTISILGTAFAITMIMAIVITWQTKYADLEPEVNRSRCLYFSAMHVYDKEKDGNNNWSNPSAAFMKECVQPVPEVEYCTAFSPAGLSLASLTDGNNRVKVDAMRTDPDFWKVFSMQFLAGRGFSEADRAGESKAVVVCASVARKLYGSTDVVGQEFLLNRELARIVGVVKDVSVTAKDAYAQVWGMYSADELKITGVHSYLGGMQIAVLARTSDDFPAIREGIAKQVERVNAGLGNKQIDIMEQPDNIVAHVNHVWANVGPDLTMLYLQYAVALFIILLVPSLNLCGLSNSRMQQRITELGVRKAFGGTKSVLVRQILNENLMLTLLGGVVGLLFSYLAVYAMRMWLFTNNQNVGTSGEFSLNMEALFSPWVFLLAFIVMWFLCDSLGCMKYTFYRPLGYNIEHVYKLSTVVGGESRDTSLTDADKYLGILAKLEQEPSVEAAALCYWSLPMSGSNSYNALVVQDTSWVQGRCIYTTGGYMDVFRISEDPRHPFRDTPAGWNNVTLSNAAFERFRKKMPEFSQTTPLGNGDSVTIIKQMGKTGAFRSYRYGVEEPWFFYHLGENMIKAEFADNWSQIVFRVKPAADGPDYREKFLREIAPKLDTDNAFVADAAPYTEQQLQFEVMNGDTDKVNSQAVVVLFLLVNVFLGLIGTFWFRTRRRRSEIALRMAMGSTRGGVFRLLIGEGLLLLALVTLPAMVVCYNVGMAEFTIGRTSLISTWPIEWSVIRFLAGSLGAWLLIALMVVIGIWFPARQAMKIEPAEALHEE